jgi:hypothetical protein
MIQWLSALEGTGLAVWVRESNSLWAYPTMLTLHTVGLAIVVGANWALDLRLLGVGRHIPLAPMKRLFPIMWTGFWLNAVTGVLLFMSDAQRFGTMNLFILKLGLIATAVGMMKFTERSVFLAADHETALPDRARALAAVSLFFWIAAITAGRMTAYTAS